MLMHHTTFCFFDASWHRVLYTSSPCCLQDLWRNHGYSLVHCLLLFHLQRRMEGTEWWGSEQVVMDEEVYVSWIIFISKVKLPRRVLLILLWKCYFTGWGFEDSLAVQEILWRWEKFWWWTWRWSFTPSINTSFILFLAISAEPCFLCKFNIHH